MARLPMEQLAYTVAEACAVARTSRTVLDEAIKSGALPAYKRGRRTLLRPADLDRWVDRLPPIRPKSKTRQANRQRHTDSGAAK